MCVEGTETLTQGGELHMSHEWSPMDIHSLGWGASHFPWTESHGYSQHWDSVSMHVTLSSFPDFPFPSCSHVCAGDFQAHDGYIAKESMICTIWTLILFEETMISNGMAGKIWLMYGFVNPLGNLFLVMLTSMIENCLDYESIICQSMVQWALSQDS